MERRRSDHWLRKDSIAVLWQAIRAVPGENGPSGHENMVIFPLGSHFSSKNQSLDHTRTF